MLIPKRVICRGPVQYLIVEDDIDDKNVFEDAISDLRLKNTPIWFPTAIEALEFLRTTNEQVFIIVCDVNLPGLNGIDFQKTIDSTPLLRRKSIPFIFYSTTATAADVEMAYTKMTIQGFFRKSNEYGEMKKVMATILDYWKTCKHPNTQ